jgi:hypothetical protein
MGEGVARAVRGPRWLAWKGGGRAAAAHVGWGRGEAGGCMRAWVAETESQADAVDSWKRTDGGDSPKAEPKRQATLLQP